MTVKIKLARANGALVSYPASAPTIVTNAVSELITQYSNTATVLEYDATTYANAVAYVDGKSYVNTSQLSSNLANYQTTAGLASNVAVLAANSAGFLGNSSGTIANVSSWITSNAGAAYINAVSYVDGKSYVNTSQLSSNLANYQTTAGLSANVATLTSNNATYVYGKTEINLNVNNALTANSSTFLGTANLQNIQTFITSNAATAYSNSVSYVDGKAYVNTAQLSSNLANYQTTTGLAANVATLAANSATYANASISNTFTIGTATYFVANGNVGIGTSSPNTKLDVAGPIRSYNSKFANGATGTNLILRTNPLIAEVSALTFYSTFATGADVLPRRSADITSGYSTGTWGSEYLSFNVGYGIQNDNSNTTIERIRITGGGNVGIGNTTPDAKLTVTGTANVSGNVVIGGALTSANLTTTTANIGSVIATSVAVGANVSLDNGNNGRLFVGNSTVNATFRTTAIAIQSSDAVNSSAIFLITELPGRSALSLSGNSGGYIDFKAPVNAAEYNQRIITNTSSISIIGGSSTTTANNILLRNANVGIGTITPDATLAVSGTANISGNVVITGGLTSANLTTSNLNLGNSTVNSSHNSSSLLFSRTVGASVGAIDISTTSTGAAFIELGGSSGSYIDFKVPFSDDYDQRIIANNSSIEIIGGSSTSAANNILLSAANVGIGTTTPDAKLTVTGTANVSGNVVIGGITTHNANVILGSSGLSANGGFGTAGQLLNSNGSATYWAADKAPNAYSNAVSYVDGKSYVNTSQLSSNLANYALLTGATFSGNVRTQQSAQVDGNLVVSGNLTVTGNVVVIGANNLSVVDNMIYLNSNSVVSNPDLGFAGNYNDGVYRHTGFFRDASDGVWKVFDSYLPEPDASPYIDTTNTSFKIANFQANIVYVGNTTVYSTINTTSFSGTANNTTNAFGKTEINLNVNNALTANSSTFLGTANLSNIQTFITSNAATAYTNAVAYVDGKAYVNTSQLSSNLANYQTTAGLASNVATLAANSATYANASISNTFTVGTSTYFIANGNVGVGVSSTNFKLDVAGPIRSSNSKFANGMTGTNLMLRTNPVVGEVSALTFYSTFTTGADTAPRRSSDITSGYSAGAWGNEYLSFNVGYGGGSNDTANTTLEKVRITSGGNVGIGNTAPDATLAITGTANVSGNVTIGGSLTTTNVATIGTSTYFVSNGNVGIGTNAPESPLHIKSTGTIQLILEADSDNINEADNARIIMKQDGGAVVGRIGYANNTNDLEVINEWPSSLHLGTANTIRITADAGGNVGIGTTTPNATLAITGTANVSGNVTIGSTLTSANLIVSNLATVGSNVQIGTNGLVLGNSTVNSAYIAGILAFSRTVGANVGAIDISTTSTGIAYLELGGTTGAYIDFKVPFSDDYDQRIQANSSSIEIVGGSSTAAANNILLSAANVGIGTTTPDARLAVVGTANISGNMTIGGSLITTNVATIGTSTYFVSNGNVGIGTNGPFYKFQIYGGLLGSTLGSTVNTFSIYSSTGNADYINFVKVREAAGSDWTTAAWRLQQVVDVTNQGYIQFNGAGLQQGISFGTANTERMRIDSSGNVGIGNTAPNAKLAITGTANVSGNVVIGGNLTTLSFVANTLGLYNTGTINAVSYTVGTSFIANTTSLYQNGPIYSNNLLLQGDGTHAYIRATTGILYIGTGSTNYFAATAAGGGAFIPTTDNLYNLGSSTNRWANIYTGDLQLSNEGSDGNDIDHTTGSWTIQEGHENLYLINRKTGKKYMFVLKEV